MKRVLLRVLVIGFVLAFGVNMADAQGRPPLGGMGGDMPCRCGDTIGPGMMGGPMVGGCGMIGGPMIGAPVIGHCGMMARHTGTRGDTGMAGIHRRLWYQIMKLDLDQKQKTEIRNIKTALMKDMIRKRADLKIAMLELGELVHSDRIDMTKVEAKVKQVEGLRSAILLSGIKALEAARSKLTAEQRKKLEDMPQNPMRCTMMGDDMMGGDKMMDEGMMEEMPPSSSEGTMEEIPEGHD